MALTCTSNSRSGASRARASASASARQAPASHAACVARAAREIAGRACAYQSEVAKYRAWGSVASSVQK